MNQPLFELQFVPHRAMQEQIRTHVRRLIVSGRLASGERLPSTEKLADLWGTHLQTIQLALTPLVREGLLTRVSRVGTFVRHREEKLTCMGIYYAEDIWALRAADFSRAVHAELKAQLNRLGIRTQVWLDPRPEAEHARPWTELCQAAANREIQGLISVMGGRLHQGWQNRLPIPSAHFGSANIPNRVATDLRQLAELSLRAVAEQGCRSVGLISQTKTNATNPDGTRHLVMDFYEHFMDLAGDLHLRVKNEWMRTPDSAHPAPAPRPPEQYGYEEFLELWRQSERPEGLIVANDVVARGVILAVREQHVRVPEELKLVVHKNETVDLFCPMPATFALLSERECAAALIAQIQKQFRGERCEPIAVPLRLMAHRGEIPKETNQRTSERSWP